MDNEAVNSSIDIEIAAQVPRPKSCSVSRVTLARN
jgi:hypothetical protein